MNSISYKKTIAVNATPSAVFEALTTGIEHWWTKPDRGIGAVGDRAKFGFPPGQSYWTFEASKLIATSHVELTCVDALHLHQGMPKEIEREWLGTRAVFDIEPRGDRTAIHFEHIGLTPELLCYDVCEAGWDFFFLDSLQSYLDTGIGKPHI